jgi:hypothetical protein
LSFVLPLLFFSFLLHSLLSISSLQTPYIVSFERQIAVSIGVKYVLSEERFHSANPSYLQFLNSILEALTREHRLKAPPTIASSLSSILSASTSLPLEPTSQLLDPFRVSRFVQAFGTGMEVRDRKRGRIDEAEPVYLGRGGELSELAILIRRKTEEQQGAESASSSWSPSSWPFVVDHDLGLIVQETATLGQIDNFLELHGSVVAQGSTRAARMAERVDRYRLKTKNELGLMNLRKEHGLLTRRLERACQGLMKPYVLNDLRENAKGLSFVISEGQGLKIDKGLELLSCGTILIPWDFDGPCE